MEENMSKLNKIITSIKEKGLIKTIKWLYETLIFRIKMKKEHLQISLKQKTLKMKTHIVTQKYYQMYLQLQVYLTMILEAAKDARNLQKHLTKWDIM